eukprot:60956-Prymnesium_polylepis.2
MECRWPRTPGAHDSTHTQPLSTAIELSGHEGVADSRHARTRATRPSIVELREAATTSPRASRRFRRFASCAIRSTERVFDPVAPLQSNRSSLLTKASPHT